MDRRQRKTREGILNAFCEILSKKRYYSITVGEIIERANVGRATFYAHFETKDFLLKELCKDLFCHIFDGTEGGDKMHRHIFSCEAPTSVFLHLLQHLQKNDRNILSLLVCENNEVFIGFFKENLEALIKTQPWIFAKKRPENIPESFWVHHAVSAFVETIRWWLENGKKESAETLSEYFETII